MIVSGPPGTGKTSLARYLAGVLRLPRITNDEIKESLFDTLGWSDRARSRALGVAAVDVLRTLAAACLAATDCLVESNFRPHQASGWLAGLLDETGARAVQVQCRADGPVLLQRFADRAASPERHPGHCDTGNVEEFREELTRGFYDPLAVPGPVLTVDNTVFHADRHTWAALAGDLRRLLHPEPEPDPNA